MYRYIVFISCIICLIGCSGIPQHFPIEVSPECIRSAADGGDFTVDVHGPEDWTTDNSSGWISIRKKENQASVSIDPNKGAARSNIITFRSGTFTETLTIIQEGSDIFSIQPESIRMSYKGGIGTIEVECYRQWTARCDCEWISLDTDVAARPSTVHISVSPSNEQYERRGEVLFECNGEIHKVLVIQDCSPYIAVENETIEINGDGGNIQILYISNTDVEVTTEDTWIRLIATTPESRKVSFEVSRNLGEERQGKIKVSSVNDPEYFKTIIVNQGEKIAHPAITFAEGHTLEVSEKGTLTLHPEFTDMTDTDLIWSSSSEETASVDNAGNVTVHTGGTCIITARNTFHAVEASITLNIRITATGMKLMLGSQDMESSPTAVRFKGEKLKVTAVMTPEDAYTGDIVCISSDQEIAKIEGMSITCLNPGKTTIYVESLYQGIQKSFTLIILEE